MKSACKLTLLFCLTLFSGLASFSQATTKAPGSWFTKDILWMIVAIVILTLLIVFMPKTTKRTTIYIKDENGNTRIMTRTEIRGKKVQQE